jgi:hypothetical protein
MRELHESDPQLIQRCYNITNGSREPTDKVATSDT